MMSRTARCSLLFRRYCLLNSRRDQSSNRVMLLTDDENAVRSTVNLLKLITKSSIYSEPTLIKNNIFYGSVTVGCTLIEVLEIKTLTAARKLLRRPKFMTPLRIDLGIQNISTPGSIEPSFIAKNFWSLTTARPRLLHLIHNCLDQSATLDNSQNSNVGDSVKEIVVGFGENFSAGKALQNNLLASGYFTYEIPSIYKCRSGMFARVLPTGESCIVFRTTDVNDLLYRDLNHEHIGQNGCAKGQIRFTCDFLYGFDIRMCENPEISPFFNFGTEMLLENSFAELQNARVVDTSPDVYVQKNGGCYSEFLAMVKRPGKFIASKNYLKDRSKFSLREY